MSKVSELEAMIKNTFNKWMLRSSIIAEMSNFFIDEIEVFFCRIKVNNASTSFPVALNHHGNQSYKVS